MHDHSSHPIELGWLEFLVTRDVCVALLPWYILEWFGKLEVIRFITTA
jgi:hypothetical protein